MVGRLGCCPVTIVYGGNPWALVVVCLSKSRASGMKSDQ